jgi:hypothetical protein
MGSENDDMPELSCILATKNRPAFLRQAIRYWKAQTACGESELIIVDDSPISCVSIVPNLPEVKYIRLEEDTCLGTKLNHPED